MTTTVPVVPFAESLILIMKVAKTSRNTTKASIKHVLMHYTLKEFIAPNLFRPEKIKSK